MDELWKVRGWRSRLDEEIEAEVPTLLTVTAVVDALYLELTCVDCMKVLRHRFAQQLADELQKRLSIKHRRFDHVHQFTASFYVFTEDQLEFYTKRVREGR